ncbi:hypothetical protein E2C01_091178 [Portunus trituberculatus]|uniref:Uncharacterized protein n=1 Tax=Portunus trituberculatus TaxID=210409 RepID=A0A5B7JSB0_PORTR|nr:hypothetical protein [Portunus trituberculatus]
MARQHLVCPLPTVSCNQQPPLCWMAPLRP